MSQCSGLTQQKLQNLDFSQIDLSEWTATLIENDMLPENSEEGLTASGRQDNSESRHTATDRTQEQADGISDMVDDRTEALENPNLDCSTSPRPPVCDYNQK